MNMESIFHRGEGDLSGKYPDLSLTQVNGAKQYLELALQGKIRNANWDKRNLELEMKEFLEGNMPDYAVEAHANDYLDYINGNERS